MNIRDAALEAQKTGRGITRRSNGKRTSFYIGTNTSQCFLIVLPDEPGEVIQKVIPRWEPNLDDITATDWQVYG